MSLSPVVIFAYNRLGSLKKTIEALQENILSSDTEVFIFSDASKCSKDDRKVQDVRSYIRNLSGFKQIYIVERDENYGLANNIISGVSDVINKYGKVIVIEDDLILSTNYLCYMNSALEFYKSIDEVFSISGYSPQLPALFDYKDDTYISYRPCSWGWGTWVDRWNTVDWDVSDYTYFINSRSERKRFNRGGIDLTRMLKSYMNGKNNSWAIRWSYSMFKQNKYCVYPKRSKVQNMGFGEDATHCKGLNIYSTKLDISCECEFDFIKNIQPDSVITRQFKYQYSYTNKLLKKIGSAF